MEGFKAETEMSKLLLVRTSQMQVYRSVNDCLLKVHLDPASQPKEKESRERKREEPWKKQTHYYTQDMVQRKTLVFLLYPPCLCLF